MSAGLCVDEWRASSLDMHDQPEGHKSWGHARPPTRLHFCWNVLAQNKENLEYWTIYW